MGSLTLAVRIKPEANRDGLNVVRIRITKDRLSVFWALNVTVPEKYFNEEGNTQRTNWVSKSYKGSEGYNSDIARDFKKAEAAVRFFDGRDMDYSAADVKAYLEQGGYPDKLLPYFVSHIEGRKRSAGPDLGKLKTADGYVSTLKVLRLYLRDRYTLPPTLSDSEIDDKYWPLGKLVKKDIQELKGWLDARYAPNSVTSYLRNLRHVLYQAADQGLVSYERFPMRGISFGIKRKQVERLHDDEIELLATAPAPTKHLGGHPAVTSPAHARPLALIMYFAHGARIGDAIMWRMENYIVEGDSHRLRYTTGKNKKSLSVLLDEEAIALLAPYRLTASGGLKSPGQFLFPYLPDDFDKLPVDQQYLQLRRAKIRARKQITDLGERIGLTKRVTPHVMRHSFADMMRRAGVPLETRQNTLGHSDIKTTRAYEEQFDQEAVDEVSLLYQKRKKKTGDNTSSTEA